MVLLLFAICLLRKSQCFPFNIECLTREPLVPFLTCLVRRGPLSWIEHRTYVPFSTPVCAEDFKCKLYRPNIQGPKACVDIPILIIVLQCYLIYSVLLKVCS